MHLPPSYKTSHPLCFSSPPLILCLSLLPFERQATHRPHRTHEAAAVHYHLPDMGQQKPKPYGYIGSGRSTILSPADTQPPTAWFTWAQMKWTLFWEQQRSRASRLVCACVCYTQIEMTSISYKGTMTCLQKVAWLLLLNKFLEFNLWYCLIPWPVCFSFVWHFQVEFQVWAHFCHCRAQTHTEADNSYVILYVCVAKVIFQSWTLKRLAAAAFWRCKC